MHAMIAQRATHFDAREKNIAIFEKKYCHLSHTLAYCAKLYYTLTVPSLPTKPGAQAYKYMYTHTHAHTYTHKPVHAYAHTNACTYTHARTHTHTHTHTRVYVQVHVPGKGGL